MRSDLNPPNSLFPNSPPLAVRHLSLPIPSVTLEGEVQQTRAARSRNRPHRFIQSGFIIVAATQRVAGALVGDRYRIQRPLGQGGIGCTYLAADEEQGGQLCVLKEFSPHRLHGRSREAARQLFVREAEVLRQLNHPQIPQFRAWVVQENCLFLVQDYIEGKNYRTLLAQRRQQGRRFSPAEVAQWLQDLLPVLDCIHRLGIIHRDLSPDNVMQPISPALSKPMLIDFGAVKWAISGEVTAATESCPAPFAGKVGYSPPEQIGDGRCDPSSDLYSLAATALVLLTGKPPSELFDSTSGRWRWRDETVASDRLGKILDKMLAPNPKRRYPSAMAVLRSLPSASGESQETRALKIARIAPPPRYNYRQIAILSIAAVLALGSLLAVQAPQIPAICKPLKICLPE